MKVTVITVATLVALGTVAALGEPIEPSDVYVVDGDTIAVFHMQPNVRLVGAGEQRRNKAGGNCAY
jgi:hypothetical protein